MISRNDCSWNAASQINQQTILQNVNIVNSNKLNVPYKIIVKEKQTYFATPMSANDFKLYSDCI